MKCGAIIHEVQLWSVALKANVCFILSIISEEISRQLINSGAKIIFGLSTASSILEEAVKMSKKPIRIVYIKSEPNESISANGIAFDELITLDGMC